MTLPNIILIVLDTLRADRVVINSKEECITPFIDKILNNSIFFENCIANSPWTLPSHIAMLTGLYPTQNRLLSNNLRQISHKIPLLTEILKDLGYFTICFTENPVINEKNGLNRGFDKIFKSWKSAGFWFYRNYLFRKYLNYIDLIFSKKIKSRKFLKFWHFIKFRLEILSEKITQQLFWKEILFKFNTLNDLEIFKQILKKNLDKKPFYIYFNIMATHIPYIAIESAQQYLNVKIKDFKKVKDLLLKPRKYLININLNFKRLSKKKIRIIKKLYNSCAYYNDLIVEKIYSILEELDILQNTYLIVTSDHGEHLCGKTDHYLWEHYTYLSVYDSVIKVPLLIHNLNFKDRIVRNQVDLKDLFHTILHLTGIPIIDNKYLNIKNSLIYQIENNSTPKYIYGEFLKSKLGIYFLIKKYRNSINKKIIPKLLNNIYFLRSDNYKYIRYNNEEEFYDLMTDTDEKFNILNPNNEEKLKMKSYMNQFLIKINHIEEIKDITTEKEKFLIKKFVKKII